MINRVSKIMWIVVGAFFIFAMIIGGITGNTLMAEWSGLFIFYALLIQIILWISGYIIKNKSKEE